MVNNRILVLLYERRPQIDRLLSAAGNIPVKNADINLLKKLISYFSWMRRGRILVISSNKMVNYS